MIQVGNWESARSGRTGSKSANFEGFVTPLISTPWEAAPVPQAFLVEQNAEVVLSTHFHRQHQFQVVIAGSGSLGRHELRPYTVHYTSPESAYGPIIAGTQGLSYLTLRAVADQGAWFVENQEVRKQMRRGLHKQQVTSDASSISDPTTLRARREGSKEILIEPQAGGLAAWLLRAPPRTAMPAPEHAAGGAGRFYIVVGGSLQMGEEALRPLSAVWVSPDEEPFLVAAGAGGLELLALQYPRKASAA